MSCQTRWRVASSGRGPARRMRQTLWRCQTSCKVQKIATVPPAISRTMSGQRTSGHPCKKDVTLLRPDDDGQTPGPHARGSPESALRRGGTEVAFRRRTRGPRGVLQLPLLVVAHVGRTRIEVPVSDHPIDSINLKDPRVGIYPQLAEFVARTGAGKGQLRIVLDPAERHSALTVNEYETLLMKYDLAEVLRNPLRFVAQQYRNAMKNPRAVPPKTLGYAKYDFVRVMNKGRDALRLRGSL